MDNYLIGSFEQQLIQEAINYNQYLDLIKECNAQRRLFNNESDEWVKTFNQKKTSENLIRILDVLPGKFVSLRKALIALHKPINDYCISQTWWVNTPVFLQAQMKDLYGWSRKAQSAKKKYLLLTNPTPEIARTVRYLDPNFYEEYLKNCQCPSLTVNDWEFRMPYLKPVLQDDFVAIKTSFLIQK